MTSTQPTVDLEHARRDPGSVFPSPEALRDHPKLTREQKIELLRRWAYDARNNGVKTTGSDTIFCAALRA